MITIDGFDDIRIRFVQNHFILMLYILVKPSVPWDLTRLAFGYFSCRPSLATSIVVNQTKKINCTMEVCVYNEVHNRSTCII